MNFYRLLLFSALGFIYLETYCQEKKFTLNPAVSTGYSKLGAVRGTAGVIEDYYYVLENDYGGQLDFNNSIHTLLSIFSISKGELIKRVNLNELVANTKKKEIKFFSAM